MTITTTDAARKLARVIASDLAIYNQHRVELGLIHDDFFERLAPEIAEAHAVFNARVPEELRGNLMDRAIVDVVIRAKAHFRCPVFG